MSSEEALIADIKERLRSRGCYVRYTEWPAGHQVVVHRRSDTSVHRVTEWHSSEAEAWREALALAVTDESEQPDRSIVKVGVEQPDLDRVRDASAREPGRGVSPAPHRAP